MKIKKTKKEIATLKEDYKECMKIIKEETFARNKAEEMVKVLEDTRDAKAERDKLIVDENPPNVVEEGVENMDIEEEEWTEVISKKKKSRDMYSCNFCEQKYTTVNDFNQHMQKHRDNRSFKCRNCNESFETQDQLKNHMINHEDIENSRKFVNNHKEIRKHNPEPEKIRHQEELKCRKCVKTYSTMVKLRRHDWRSHRQVPCNICEETIESRQEISNHRKLKHNMLRKVACKFYPACYDGDECFFSHENSENSIADQDKPSPFCPNGIECSDQLCQYGEYSHKNVKEIDCKFQANCNRKNCPFVHSVERKAFLGESRTLKKGT